MNEKACNLFKEAKEEFEKEVIEHKIIEKFQKNPKKYKDYLNYIDGLEGLRNSFINLCEKGESSLTEDDCNKLNIAGDEFRKELEKYDIFIPKKAENRIKKFIDIIKGVHFSICINKSEEV